MLMIVHHSKQFSNSDTLKEIPPANAYSCIIILMTDDEK